MNDIELRRNVLEAAARDDISYELADRLLELCAPDMHEYDRRAVWNDLVTDAQAAQALTDGDGIPGEYEDGAHADDSLQTFERNVVRALDKLVPWPKRTALGIAS